MINFPFKCQSSLFSLKRLTVLQVSIVERQYEFDLSIIFISNFLLVFGPDGNGEMFYRHSWKVAVYLINDSRMSCFLQHVCANWYSVKRGLEMHVLLTSNAEVRQAFRLPGFHLVEVTQLIFIFLCRVQSYHISHLGIYTCILESSIMSFDISTEIVASVNSKIKRQKTSGNSMGKRREQHVVERSQENQSPASVSTLFVSPI